MEKTWERIQQKTFTKWVNSHLRKRKLAIENLQKDFGDGTLFIQFLEIISGQNLPKYEKKPKIRIQKIGNVSVGLDFLKSQKIQLVNISGEDIVDENLKLILGLIWTIIQKFQIDDISEEQLSAKEALLLWCQKKTAGYKDVKVDNFTWSFQDGLALCALIHRHRPDLLDFSKLNKDNKAANLQLAFDVAERDLGIPKLLDVEDMVDIKPDERSVITYVSQYYHVFSKYNQAEVAGRRIGKLVDLTSALEAMKNDYGDKAKKLADWIKNTTTNMQDRTFDNTLEGVRNKIGDFKGYRSDEKPPKTADKATVEALFNNINLKLRANNRPPFDPPTGLSPSDIEGLWSKLGQEEVAREAALIEELRRQEKLAHLRSRFNLKDGKLDAWLTAKEEYLRRDEHVDSINEAETKLKNHDAFDDEYAKAKSRFDELGRLAAEIAALAPPDANDYLAKADRLQNRYRDLAGPQASKRADLENKLAKEKKKEELRLEFARQAKEYNQYNKETSNAVNDHNFGDSLEAVQNYRAHLDSSDADISNTSNSKKDSLDKLWDEMQALGVTENRYTPLTNKDIEAAHKHLLDEIEKRKAAYELELQRQLNMEQKRKEFAEKANAFADSLVERKKLVDDSTRSGEPASAISEVKSLFQDGNPENQKLAVLQGLQEEMSALGIRDNKHTMYTLPILQVKNTQFSNDVRNVLSALQDEQDLKAEYNAKAQALVDWVQATIPKLQERNFDNTLQGARAVHNDWQKYLTAEKGAKEIDHINVNNLFQKITALVASSGRPAFTPNPPIDQAGIQALWEQLSAAEKAKESDVNAELARQEKIHTLVKRFKSEAEELDAWVAEKEPYLNSKEDIHDLDTARLRSRFLEVFNAEFAQKNPALQSLNGLVGEIVGLNYHDSASIQAAFNKLQETFTRFSTLAAAKNSDLQEALRKQQANEDLRVAFAEQARDFTRFVRDSVDHIGYSNFGFTLDAVSAYQAELDKSDSEITGKADQLKAALDTISSDLANAGVSDNRHTQLTQNDLQSQRGLLDQAIQKRRSNYQTELARQTQNEDIRKRFAEKANGYISYVENQKSSLEKLSGTPEDRIGATQNIYQDGAPSNTSVTEIKSIADEMRSANIYDNKYTPYSLPIIETRKNQWDTSVKNFLQGLNEEKEFNERARQLQAEYEHKLKLENLRIGYAKDAESLHLWLENANEILTDPIRCDSVAEVDALQKALDQILSEKEHSTSSHNRLVDLAAEMRSEGISDFGKFPIEEVNNEWQRFQSDVENRQHALSQERSRQEVNEGNRVAYANQAKALQQFIQQNFAFVNNLPGGSLEAQLAALQDKKSSINSAGDQIGNIEDLSRKLEEASVTENKHTDIAFPTLKVDYEQLVKVTQQKETLLQKEIIQKSNTGVSAEQLAEFKEVFEHFDKDRAGSLARLDFKACLQSLDYDYSDAEIDSTIASIGTNGRVTFEAFCNFMSSKAGDSDTKDQILEAFKVLAGDKAFITEEDMRRALPAEKVQYLTQNMPAYQGQAGSYDYVAWSNKSFH
jgi:actinin alpha